MLQQLLPFGRHIMNKHNSTPTDAFLMPRFRENVLQAALSGHMVTNPQLYDIDVESLQHEVSHSFFLPERGV
eukprot:867525-Pelagomonas_calceolata.AAC.1